jgi:hypothetical protein
MARRRAMGQAVRVGADGERLLVDALVSAKNSADRVSLVAHLGELNGPLGGDALRAVLAETGRKAVDLRCAALLALAKRLGGDSTPLLLEALKDASGAVRGYALLGLAGAGDDRAWEEVLLMLQSLVGQPSGGERAPYSDRMACVLHLGQHCEEHPDRLVRLVTVLRSSWGSLSPQDRAQLKVVWPGLESEGGDLPAPPDEQLLRAFAREPLFRPLPLH